MSSHQMRPLFHRGKVHTELGHTNTRRHHPLIVVGVDADVVILEVKGELAELDVLQFVLVEIRPAPEASVDDMGESLPPCNLEGHRQEGRGGRVEMVWCGGGVYCTSIWPSKCPSLNLSTPVCFSS